MIDGQSTRRPRIAFFDYPDVFEDFYPHYGVDRDAFARRWAGTGNHELAALLQQAVGDVTWYERTVEPPPSDVRLHELGFTVRFVRSSSVHRWLWRRFYLAPDAWKWQRHYPVFAALATYAAPLSWAVAKAVVHDRPDALFVQDYANGVFDVLAAATTVTRHPLVTYHSGSFAGGYVPRWPKRWTVRRADALLVPGGAERSRLVTEHHVRPQHIHRVLTPVDTDAYTPAGRESACIQAGLDPARRYVLFMGRIDDSVKRVRAIVRAFAAIADRHDDADLVVAGDGPDIEPLRRLAGEIAPGRVVFTGWVGSVERKAALYNAADCLVLASRSEGFPTVVAEALSCGTPVVGTDVGAVAELVRDGQTGWLVTPADSALHAALTSRLDGVLTAKRDPHVRAECRRTAVAEVSRAVVGEQLRAVFADVLPRELPPRAA